MSKGSTPRPFSVSNEEYAARWDAIFQRDLPAHVDPANTSEKRVEKEDEIKHVPRSLIEGIMSTETCGHPFCDCKDVCKEAK